MQDCPVTRSPRRTLLAALILFTLAPVLAALEVPVLVRDVGQTPVAVSSSPKLEARLGDWIYFAASDPFHGEELWRTDGTADGTERVADLCPGPCGSSPYGITALAGRLFFSADDGATGRELWVSDGTRAGTRRTRDVCPGSCGAVPARNETFSLAELSGEVFFAADDGISGRELWKTDGTRAGTVQVADIQPGTGTSNPGPLTSFAGAILFPANGPGLVGRELWTSDGTREGTRLFKDISQGFYGSSPVPVGVTGTHLLLKANFSALRQRLWTLNLAGSLQAIVPCYNVACGAVTVALFKDFVILGASEAGSSVLWRVDLPSRNATRLRTFPGPLEQAPPRNFAVIANRVVLFAASDSGSGEELWATDGTPEGTRQVADLQPGPGSSSPSGLTVLGDRAVFAATTDATGRELWTSDGTPGGTRLLKDVAPEGSSSPAGFAHLGGKLLFTASSAEAGAELWQTDGTEAGTGLLEDLAVDPGSSAPVGLTAWNGYLYFGARGSNDGLREAWRTDGTEAGTARLEAPGASRLVAPEGLYPDAVAKPFEFTPFAGRLIFSAGVPSEDPGGSVWRTDGTPAGTVQVPGTDGVTRGFTEAGGTLFLAGNPVGSVCTFDCGELHALDSAASAVRLVSDINPSQDNLPLWPPLDISSRPHSFVPLGARIVLAVDEGLTGSEVWASDGTEAGTLKLATLCQDFQSGAPRLARLGSHAVFTTSCKKDGTAIWRTDATPAGTVRLRTFPGNAPIPDLAVAGDRAFFLVRGAAGDELWATDGTAAGTVRVSDLALDGTPARARRMAAVGGRVFFAVFHEALGEELWTSDGTAAGTRLVADLAPGPESSAPQAFAAIAGRLAFAATDGVSGLEPWGSDGTPAGTRRLADVAPGADASSPDGFAVSGDRLFFAASHPTHGRELWAFPLSGLDRAGCRPTDTALCLLGGRFEVTVRFKTGEGAGVGHALHRSDQTGLFWFFDEGNTELLVKMLDGGPVNGHTWFFSGALSDVEYWVDIRDTAASTIRTYHNPQGNLCGRVDTQAFPLAPEPAALAAPLEAAPQPLTPVPSCLNGSNVLCLGERFHVTVTFKNPLAGNAETQARAIPGTGDTGYFWFFDEANFELAVKILDGTPVNGKHWVFWGALSDVEYTLTVIDTLNLNVKEYRNPRGQVCGGADTSAF
ncbi:MAG TPA: ELWxxDGT repeat protein [Thermoanaerobaculia bacterium]|nr:ELWxxDGT repeat protein [Thermoanaerobaculia bacterium]